MSRRRQRGEAYRLRRKFRYYASGRRSSPFTTHVDPAMLKVLTAPLLASRLYDGIEARVHAALGNRMLGITGPLTPEQEADVAVFCKIVTRVTVD